MRILILGGTGHIGAQYVLSAVSRGHHVFVFSRGQTSVVLPPEVIHLKGDRNSDMTAIQNTDWDAVLDLATFVPMWVRKLGTALKGRVKHYTFVSTEAVYQELDNADSQVHESTKVLEYAGTVDPYSLTTLTSDDQYGALKVLCEREAKEQFPGRTLILRPGAIVGPDDAIGSLTYWCVRMLCGGEILAAGDPIAPVQMIDLRDLADWTIRLVEKYQTGTFNAVGPAERLGWAEMLGGLRTILGASVTLTWVPTSWLNSRQVSPASNLLFFPCEAGVVGLMHMNNQNACAHGLTFRPLSATVLDTLAWYKDQPAERQNRLLLGVEGFKQDTIEVSLARERQLLTLWHASHERTSS